MDKVQEDRPTPKSLTDIWWAVYNDSLAKVDSEIAGQRATRVVMGLPTALQNELKE